ncbi:MAG: radical SAM protein [Candidatus Hydrogenedentes bacterium]|nr:radical SAM protein [Candidatus Hydrogenedentota bacterium]
MERLLRQTLLKCLTGERQILLRKRAPSRDELHEKFDKIHSLGIYVHVPFCERICPYCPYNKEIYRDGLAKEYVRAVKKEIDSYGELLDGKPVTSLYIGGGTPTTMLRTGLVDLIGHLRNGINLQCGIHMESHPNHLSSDNLDELKAMGVRHLSIGVESLVDRHLKLLQRPYTVEEVKAAVRRAVSQGFDCVNVDVMFALPEQTYREIEELGYRVVDLGVDQVAAYPLFRFSYTPLGQNGSLKNHGMFLSLKRRRMLAILEKIFYQAGYERSSVWAFTKRGVPRYCSVTVPLYIGLGASGGTYLTDLFYLNTFGVAEYIKAMDERETAIALSLELSERMQQAGWLYWRIYETRFTRSAYFDRFGEDIETAFGSYLRLFRVLGFLREYGDQIVLSDRGSFWLHAWEDVLSIEYINKLWGASKRNLWPEKVVL